MRKTIHVFDYDGAGAADDAILYRKVRDASVRGTLFDVDGVGRALMLAGSGTVAGEIRSYRTSDLGELDARAGVRERMYTRVGVDVDGTACWTWVAGPRLAPHLAPDGAARHTEDES